MQVYAPRPIEFHGVREWGAWRIKLYSIRYGERPLDWPTLEAGLNLAEAALPASAVAPGRPGVGFVIAHQGKTGDYVVLGWWDNENELPLRIFVRDADGWRPARGGESACVWDLEVIWHEREAYVATFLATRDDAASEYLTRSGIRQNSD
jgi:hypothetical protein